MNYSSATGLSIHQTVALIMLAKPLNKIVGQPTTESMDRMMKQIAQMVAPVKPHGVAYMDPWLLSLMMRTTPWSPRMAAPLSKPTTINPKINKLFTPYEILTLQKEMKTLQKEFEHQEAVTTIGVQCIINSIKEQYVDKLNKDYFGYANHTIKTLLTHLHTKWCKAMMKERTNATEAFYQAWVPSTTHIITFGRQLHKQQKSARPSTSSSWT
jgi:hypothetical protein